MVRHAWLMAVLLALPHPITAQNKPQFVPTLPQPNWRQMDSQPLPLSAINKYGGDPAIEQEYGVKALELRTYELGKVHRQVLVEPATDASCAYGLLTFYQAPDMQPVKDMELAVGDASQTLMARGNKFLRFLRGKESISASDDEGLLKFVGGDKPSARALKELPTPLPSKDLVPGSEKYVLGISAAKRLLPSFRSDLIGFDQSAELQLGEYETRQGKCTLLSISYPTPQIARLRFGSLTDILKLNQNEGANSIYGKRHGSYVFLVLNPPNAESASALLGRFQVTEGVNWDQKYQTEKTFTLEVVHMILAIFLLTGILICACMVSGILFFLSRRLAAKFFPQWQWGRTDEDQLIRLNLKL